MSTLVSIFERRNQNTLWSAPDPKENFAIELGSQVQIVQTRKQTVFQNFNKLLNFRCRRNVSHATSYSVSEPTRGPCADV
jgi:hypothetical protein